MQVQHVYSFLPDIPVFPVVGTVWYSHCQIVRGASPLTSLYSIVTSVESPASPVSFVTMCLFFAWSLL